MAVLYNKDDFNSSKGKKNFRIELAVIDNATGPTPTVEENRQTRPKKYFELTEAQLLQDDYDVQAKNIILHGLPPNVYALVNHQKQLKDIWDRGETLYEYYWRFSQLINDMHTIRMTMQQVQVNTKFLNALPPEWSKFVTDVKLAKSLYITNYDQLYAYLSQHERHANEVLTPQSEPEFPQLDSGLAIPTFQQGEDPIDCINKVMAFQFDVASRFPTSNNQLRTSSIPKIRQPFKMEESQFNKLKEDKLRVLLDVQEMTYSEQTHIDDYPDDEINSDSNIIPYS
ncbi:hypothetical protein Tco_0592774 [Tanacetum coccineum]